jgi:hypothetical protein
MTQSIHTEQSPLDIHLWTDIPLPELGPVEPVLWKEIEAGLDGVMLATGGVWLECIPHAAEAYKGLFTADGLKSARKSSEGVSLIIDIISKTPGLVHIQYQRTGERQRPTQVSVFEITAHNRDS